MSLDQEMVRYFGFMRPRYSNPTYASSNVSSTLGFLQLPQSQSLLKLSDKQPLEIQRKPTPQSQRPIQNQEAVKNEEKRQNSSHFRSKSLMSNYGTSSLGKLPRVVNERDIYEKQEKKYNIITIQPKDYRQTIKKYPKYHLENQDQNYYKKLQLEDEYHQMSTSQIKHLQNPEQYKQAPQQENMDNKSAFFRPKMLNNIDELGGVL